jgi:hypothetical protein
METMIIILSICLFVSGIINLKYLAQNQDFEVEIHELTEKIKRLEKENENLLNNIKKLCERKTALKVNSIVLDMNPLETLPIIKQDVYKALPDTFETGEGKIIAKKLGMSDRTFGRFLDNKKLFKNIEWGKYEKRY